MTSILVHEGTLHTLANTLDGIADTINSQVSGVDSTTGDIASGWKGTASGAFADAMQSWHDQSSNATQILSSAATALRQVQKSFDTTDEARESAFDRVAARLRVDF